MANVRIGSESQAGKNGIGADDQCARTPSNQRCEGAIKIIFLSSVHDDNLNAEAACSLQDVLGLILGVGIRRIDQDCDWRGGRHHLMDEPLGDQSGREYANASEIAARSIEAGHEADSLRVVAGREDDWNRRDRHLGGPRRDCSRTR